MYSITQIRHVHLEISSKCNAECPLCPRNFYGYPHNDGYVEHNMTLVEAQHIFQPSFLQQLNEIYINGNFGDAVMNPETIDIIKYFKTCNPDIEIWISTNAGARDQKFWESLAHLGTHVDFCIDGLENTHSLYRKNTVYSTVIKNAKIFIDAGGQATWKMIDFDHNRDQQQQARQLSTELGFVKFLLIDAGRDQAPVFDKNKKLMHVIGSPTVIDFDQLWKARKTINVELADITSHRTERPIVCAVKKNKSIYISSTGEVYPCCFLGISPKTYNRSSYQQVANAQFAPHIQENNALEYDLAHCINWFSAVAQSWDQPTFAQGRLIICNDVCGQ